MFTLRSSGDLFEDATALADELERLRAVSAFIETYPLGNRSHLRNLLTPFLDAQNRPSTHIRRLMRIVVATSLRGNMLLWFAINLIVPWDVYFAHRLNELKADLANYLPVWLDTWFELEALVSLATFAYLNPEYTFPEITGQAAPTA